MFFNFEKLEDKLHKKYLLSTIMNFYCFTVQSTNSTYVYVKIANNYIEELVIDLMKKSKVWPKLLTSPIANYARLAVMDKRTVFTRDNNINDDEPAATSNEIWISLLHSEYDAILLVLAVTPI